MEPLLVPFGVLEVLCGALTMVFGTSRETSDFIGDALQQWWELKQSAYPQIRELVIDLDNGSELASRRTQFIKRMVQFALPPINFQVDFCAESTLR
jgi:hypothetical protein